MIATQLSLAPRSEALTTSVPQPTNTSQYVKENWIAADGSLLELFRSGQGTVPASASFGFVHVAKAGPTKPVQQFEMYFAAAGTSDTVSGSTVRSFGESLLPATVTGHRPSIQMDYLRTGSYKRAQDGSWDQSLGWRAYAGISRTTWAFDSSNVTLHSDVVIATGGARLVWTPIHQLLSASGQPGGTAPAESKETLRLARAALSAASKPVAGGKGGAAKIEASPGTKPANGGGKNDTRPGGAPSDSTRAGQAQSDASKFGAPSDTTKKAGAASTEAGEAKEFVSLTFEAGLTGRYLYFDDVNGEALRRLAFDGEKRIFGGEIGVSLQIREFVASLYLPIFVKAASDHALPGLTGAHPQFQFSVRAKLFRL